MANGAVPILRTPRLTLRPLEMSDAAQIVDGVGNYDVSKWLSVVPYPYDMSDAEDFLTTTLEHDHEVWAIVDDSGLIGVVGIRNELGYWLARRAWRKGYGLEAAQAATAHWFSDPSATDLSSSWFEGNTRSASVLSALGFRETGIVKRQAKALSQEVDAHEMRLTPEDWHDRQNFRLSTDRLTIRPLTADDTDMVLPLGHPDVARQTASVIPGWSRKQAHHWLRTRTWAGRSSGMLGVFQGETFVGTVGSGGHPSNAGWMFLPEHWGNGFATESLGAFLPAFLQRTTHSALVAEVFEDNGASRRVAEKLGFAEIGRGMGKSPGRVDPAPVVQYRLSRDAASKLR